MNVSLNKEKKSITIMFVENGYIVSRATTYCSIAPSDNPKVTESDDGLINIIKNIIITK